MENLSEKLPTKFDPGVLLKSSLRKERKNSIWADETILLEHPCDQDNNGGCERICKKEGAGRSCACPEGFKLAADNKKCEESKLIITFYIYKKVIDQNVSLYEITNI